ncbi:hypothetical protein BM524_18240 [Alteromonas mediterranea]|uniref:Uncharacterized protein n=1 Tax=Alteromonas mediterranea TaxID=314275 RepID=A0AAC9NTA6_9ALTE|nr:hypothetical protein [Alteromonas mediterranea]APD91579.1 hypothetical protein BM524_18240 [Alteromonas mediterranea]
MKKALILIVAIAILSMVFTESDYKYIQYRDAQMVYNSATVPVETAKKFHLHWATNGGYDNKSGDVVLLEKSNDGAWVVKTPVFTGAETNPKIVGSFAIMGAEMKKSVFNNEELELHMADPSFNSLKILKI